MMEENTNPTNTTQGQSPMAMPGPEKVEKLKFSRKEENLTKLDILKKLSSGTGLREGLNEIVSASKGAIIVVDNPKVPSISSGGFYVNCDFTPKRLFELAKMDGAIILSGDFKKIFYANTLLTPDRKFTTTETGIRHQSAERTAKHIKGLVITVSERRGAITIYYGNSKYVLEKSGELLRRATETLQILEKQRDVFDDLLKRVDILEINNLVTVGDVVAILQRYEIINKIFNVIEEYLVELGKEGMILNLRMTEIMGGVKKSVEAIIVDYIVNKSKVVKYFAGFSFDNIFDSQSIAQAVFGKNLDAEISPRGYRLLNKTNLGKSKIAKLVNNLKNFGRIINANKEELKKLFPNNPEIIEKELDSLREHIIVGNKL